MKLHILLAILIIPCALLGQEYDLLIKNGHVIDPKNNRLTGSWM